MRVKIVGNYGLNIYTFILKCYLNIFLLTSKTLIPVLVAQEALKISLWRNTRWSRVTSCSVSFEETIVTIGCESDDIIRQTEANTNLDRYCI